MTNMSTMMRRNFGKSSNPYRISGLAVAFAVITWLATAFVAAASDPL